MSQRAIKFRAWDTKDLKYLYPYPNAFWIIGETTVFDMLKRVRMEDFNSILIEQFTGLQDSKGVDIYEGDVVLYRCAIKGDWQERIQWDNKLCGFSSSTEAGTGFLSKDINGFACEVIGNVHQSPKLGYTQN